MHTSSSAMRKNMRMHGVQLQECHFRGGVEAVIVKDFARRFRPRRRKRRWAGKFKSAYYSCSTSAVVSRLPSNASFTVILLNTKQSCQRECMATHGKRWYDEGPSQRYAGPSRVFAYWGGARAPVLTGRPVHRAYTLVATLAPNTLSANATMHHVVPLLPATRMAVAGRRTCSLRCVDWRDQARRVPGRLLAGADPRISSLADRPWCICTRRRIPYG